MPFISIEGVDGSGKTTQSALLADYLRGAGKNVVQTKEPDGGHIGAAIRAIFTDARYVLSPVEQLLLANAARYDHVRGVVRPALQAGGWVVSDRFVDSTFAFQVAVSTTDILRMHEEVTAAVVGATMPDLTIVLDLPLEVAKLRRAVQTDAARDPAEELRDFAKIREGLIEAVRRDPARCRIIDADREEALVAANIREMVGTFL